ncbi:MAG TPA: ankyrin repeat domain-containing protein, partial [Mycobacterium sp.]
NQPTILGDTPLMSSLARAPRGTYVGFLGHPRVDFDAVNNDGKTPLYLAVESSNAQAVEDIVSRCSYRTCNMQTRRRGDTALCLAARSTTPESATAMVRILLSNQHVDASIADYEGKTPLHHAAIVGNLETCRLLGIRLDGGVTAECKKGLTPLGYAKRLHHGLAPLLVALTRMAEALPAGRVRPGSS